MENDASVRNAAPVLDVREKPRRGRVTEAAPPLSPHQDVAGATPSNVADVGAVEAVVDE